jgi:hypothetical protein
MSMPSTGGVNVSIFDLNFGMSGEHVDRLDMTRR